MSNDADETAVEAAQTLGVFLIGMVTGVAIGLFLAMGLLSLP